MKVCEAWLREWVNPAVSAQQLETQLTMAGLEVDALTPVAGEFSHVVVAHVQETRPHPQADRLTLCRVETGNGAIIQVVCGAANVRAGLNVALALPGAQLPGGLKIKESTLRGELSQGMLCSVSELGMDERSDGIMELPQNAPLGLDLREYLSLNGFIFDIDLTPNRADCFSVLGVAREVAALNKLSLKPTPKPLIHPMIHESLTIHLHAPAACPQYCGRIIRGINPHAVTPLWIKERLRRAGIRALHPVVDVTNYVMIELGQPMHAFDLNAINSHIDVRFAKDDEALVLLDGQEINLNDHVLVIADAKRPLAIAGIMGGANSAVQAHTTDVFLESAFFNPVVIAGVARRYGLCSDSSQRFERGVDPAIQTVALERATELLLSIVGGETGPLTSMSIPEQLPRDVEVVFNPAKVKRLTGLELSVENMESMLQSLGMTVLKNAEAWAVKVPSHRFDISLDVDLVEEIVRLYGYDNIVALPLENMRMQAGEVNSVTSLSAYVSTFLSTRGYRETINYSFVDPHFQNALYPDTQSMALLNPISSELSHMRVGMWPGLLAAMVYNLHRQQTAIKFFEVGVVFDVNGEALQERPCLAGLLTGERGHLNWSEATHQFDFFDMKGDLQALFAALSIDDVHFVAASHPALHPGQSARILIGEREVGWMGVLHPRLVDALDINADVMLFELSLSELVHDKPANFQRISKYPQIRRDLSLLVSHDVSAWQIEAVVRDVVKGNLLKAFDVFDVYTGESIPVGKKSLAIALTLQDDSRTLVDTEVANVTSAILKELDDKFTIVLRDVTKGDAC